MPEEYNIVLDLNVPLVQHDRHKVSIKANKEIESQFKNMTSQGIITLR